MKRLAILLTALFFGINLTAQNLDSIYQDLGNKISADLSKQFNNLSAKIFEATKSPKLYVVVKPFRNSKGEITEISVQLAQYVANKLQESLKGTIPAFTTVKFLYSLNAGTQNFNSPYFELEAEYFLTNRLFILTKIALKSQDKQVSNFAFDDVEILTDGKTLKNIDYCILAENPEQLASSLAYQLKLKGSGSLKLGKIISVYSKKESNFSELLKSELKKQLVKNQITVNETSQNILEGKYSAENNTIKVVLELKDQTDGQLKATAASNIFYDYLEKNSVNIIAGEEDIAIVNSLKISKKDTVSEDILHFFGIDFKLIKGDEFYMGDDFAFDDAKPKHKVFVDDFYISKTEITVGQYLKFLQDVKCDLQYRNSVLYYKNKPLLLLCQSINCPDFTQYYSVVKSDTCTEISLIAGYANYPIVNITWYGAKAFATWLSIKTGKIFDLPTEAQWYFAAKGKSSYKYSGSNNIDEVAWYARNSFNSLHSVGMKKPNAYGLYDMTGNASEWCKDWYSAYYFQEKNYYNPQGPKSGTNKVIKGGSYLDDDINCSVEKRFYFPPTMANFNLGFRVVLNP